MWIRQLDSAEQAINFMQLALQYKSNSCKENTCWWQVSTLSFGAQIPALLSMTLLDWEQQTLQKGAKAYLQVRQQRVQKHLTLLQKLWLNSTKMPLAFLHFCKLLMIFLWFCMLVSFCSWPIDLAVTCNKGIEKTTWILAFKSGKTLSIHILTNDKISRWWQMSTLQFSIWSYCQI